MTTNDILADFLREQGVKIQVGILDGSGIEVGIVYFFDG